MAAALRRRSWHHGGSVGVRRRRGRQHGRLRPSGLSRRHVAMATAGAPHAVLNQLLSLTFQCVAWRTLCTGVVCLLCPSQFRAIRDHILAPRHSNVQDARSAASVTWCVAVQSGGWPCQASHASTVAGSAHPAALCPARRGQHRRHAAARIIWPPHACCCRCIVRRCHRRQHTWPRAAWRDDTRVAACPHMMLQRTFVLHINGSDLPAQGRLLQDAQKGDSSGTGL